MWCVHKGQRPNLIEGLPRPIEQLMVQCWDPSPINRPSMEEVHGRMKALCEFFPEAEPLSMEDGYEEEIVSWSCSVVWRGLIPTLFSIYIE